MPLRLDFTRLFPAAFLTSFLFAVAPPAIADEICGATEETACEVPLGSYYAVMPEASEGGKKPAVIFFHGGGGWGSRIFKSRAQMTEDFLARGYAVIAPNGKKRPGSRFGPGWAFIPQLPKQRDDLAFLKEILEDVQTRFDIDRDRILLTGYSIGGSIVSYFACTEPELVKAFAPVAGGFWRPHPEDCAGPVKLLHTHGWRDQTVPLEGRPLRQLKDGKGLVAQGDIYQTLNQWRIENGCEKWRADAFETDGPFWLRTWTHCAPGTALQFALHPGGHEVPDAWANHALDWFEALDAQVAPSKKDGS
ncbi:MAG: alpha/beta fold hydrolase [Pseudomonadota bacterium]